MNTVTPALVAPPAEHLPLRHLEPNPLRDIHKGIRAALFAVTAEAGRLDPSDDVGVAALASEVREVAELLADHARHEDEHFDLTLLPTDLGARVETDHRALAARMAWIGELARSVPAAAHDLRRNALHELYVELAAFTGAYLLHQDSEERVVQPTLFDRIGAPGVAAIHEEIVRDMRPDEFTRGMVAMLPAINIDDRCEMLGGMLAGMPPEAFAGVWSLASSLLADHDAAALADRLGLARP